MIWRTYKVFGSGCCGVCTAVRPDMTVGEYLRADQQLSREATDDGHNGFVGTESVPTELAESLGVYRRAWFDPGPTASTPIREGWQAVTWRPNQYRMLVERMPAVAGMKIAEVEAASRGTIDETIAALMAEIQ